MRLWSPFSLLAAARYVRKLMGNFSFCAYLIRIDADCSHSISCALVSSLSWVACWCAVCCWFSIEHMHALTASRRHAHAHAHDVRSRGVDGVFVLFCPVLSAPYSDSLSICQHRKITHLLCSCRMSIWCVRSLREHLNAMERNAGARRRWMGNWMRRMSCPSRATDRRNGIGMKKKGDKNGKSVSFGRLKISGFTQYPNTSDNLIDDIVLWCICIISFTPNDDSFDWQTQCIEWRAQPNRSVLSVFDLTFVW